MNQYQNTNILPNPALRERARGVLANRYGQAILAFFLAWLIAIVVGLLSSFLLSFLWSIIFLIKQITVNHWTMSDMMALMMDPSSLEMQTFSLNVVDHVLGLILSFFTNVLNVGLSFFCLKLDCGRQTTVSDIFYGFKNQFGKSLKITIVYTLIRELAILPLTVYLYLWRDNAPGNMQLLCLALTVCGIVLAVCLTLPISQAYFLLLDFPDHSAGELLRLSARIMNGHKMRLLLLHLSFLPLFLLSLLTFGIANLWLIPYRNVSCSVFFLNLMQARDQNN